MAENSGDLSLGYMMGQTEGGGGMFGNDSWIGLILFALIFGWGRGGAGGFGGGGYGESCATQADVRAAVDQQTLISKLDQQTYGLADSTYALNNTLNSNFRGIDNAICTLGYNVQSGFNNIGHQISDCCCATQRSIDGVNYNMAKGFCDLGNTIQNTTRDIIDNQNCGTRAILDFLTNEKIDSLRAENQALRFQASQVAQNQYLVNQLRPCPVPAFITCNPYSSIYGTGYSNSGCGCGCG